MEGNRVVAAAWRQLDMVRKCHMKCYGTYIGMSSEVRGEWEGNVGMIQFGA